MWKHHSLLDGTWHSGIGILHDLDGENVRFLDRKSSKWPKCHSFKTLCAENTPPVSCEVEGLDFPAMSLSRLCRVGESLSHNATDARCRSWRLRWLYPLCCKLTHPSAFVPVLWGRHRFVSLLPFQRRPSVGEQRAQSWNSPHAFLAAGRGDASDHALLLCSFLLGFGLDAFVCVGQVYSFDNAEREKGVSARQGSGNGCHGDEAKRGEETGHMVSVW